MYAGLYTFALGTATSFVLDEILILFGEVIGLPASYSLVVLASPSLLVGAVVWWAVVERRNSYTYLRGGAFGLLTALLTGLLWTLRLVSVWGVEMLTATPVAVLVAFVLGVVSVAGALTGLPLLYARRRLAGG